MQALKHLMDFGLRDHNARDKLNELGALPMLRAVHLQLAKRLDVEADLLLNRSRRALICLSDVTVNAMALELNDGMLTANRDRMVALAIRFLGCLRCAHFSLKEQILRESNDI